MPSALRRTALAGLLALVAAPSVVSAVSAAPAPHLSLASYDKLRTPLPYPYDEKADAGRQVEAARQRARKSGKRLLIDFGGNWCPDCRILAGTIEQTELKPFIDRHFEFVAVDIGGKDRGKNQDVAARYDLKIQGVPALVVVDPRTDKVLNRDQVTALSDARHMSPQGLADYVARWAR